MLNKRYCLLYKILPVRATTTNIEFIERVFRKSKNTPFVSFLKKYREMKTIEYVECIECFCRESDQAVLLDLLTQWADSWIVAIGILPLIENGVGPWIPSLGSV
jgi:hypothetical protein